MSSLQARDAEPRTTGDDLAERVWAQAVSLAEDPAAIDLVLDLHSERPDRPCAQCPSRDWPCSSWQAGMLARALGANPTSAWSNWFTTR